MYSVNHSLQRSTQNLYMLQLCGPKSIEQHIDSTTRSAFTTAEIEMRIDDVMDNVESFSIVRIIRITALIMGAVVMLLIAFSLWFNVLCWNMDRVSSSASFHVQHRHGHSHSHRNRSHA